MYVLIVVESGDGYAAWMILSRLPDDISKPKPSSSKQQLYQMLVTYRWVWHKSRLCYAQQTQNVTNT